jgi:hypothetical protein
MSSCQPHPSSIELHEVCGVSCPGPRLRVEGERVVVAARLEGPATGSRPGRPSPTVK